MRARAEPFPRCGTWLTAEPVLVPVFLLLHTDPVPQKIHDAQNRSCVPGHEITYLHQIVSLLFIFFVLGSEPKGIFSLSYTSSYKIFYLF